MSRDKEECAGCGYTFEADRNKCEDCHKYTICDRHKCQYCQHCREYKDSHK